MKVLAKCRQSTKKIAIDSEQGSGRTAQKPSLVSSTVGPYMLSVSTAVGPYVLSVSTAMGALRAQCISV